MIDKDTGILKLNELTVSPSITCEEFLSSSVGKKAGIFLENTPFCSYRLEMELPDEKRKAGKWSVILYFSGNTIEMVSLTVLDDMYGTSWDDWSEEKEMERKKYHDEWLEFYIDLKSPYSFPWGEIISVYDSRTGGSSIFIKYKNIEEEKHPKEKKLFPRNKLEEKKSFSRNKKVKNVKKW